MSRLGPIAMGVTILVAFAATLVFLYQRSRPVEEPYQTLVPKIRDIERKTVATGAIQPRHEVALKSRIGGIIDELMVEPGHLVNVGDVVARIRVIPDMVRLNEAEAALEAARIRYSAAKREYERFTALSSVVSDAEVTRQRLDYELALQQVTTAKNNLALVREGAVKGSAKANNLVAATVAGMVLDVPVELGTTVIESNQFNDGTTIATVANMEDMIFVGFVDESEVGKLKPGMPLSIQIGALPDIPFSGTLEHIAPKGVKEEGTMQFEVRAALTQQEGVFVRAGFSANANIVLERREQVLAIDEAALRFEGNEVFVEVEREPQDFVRRKVEVGLSDGRFIEVREGLSADERVKKPKS